MNCDSDLITKMYNAFVLGLDLPDDDASDEWRILNGHLDELRNSDPDPFIKVLNDSQAPNRIASAWALGIINGNKHVDAMIQALSINNSIIRIMLIKSLGHRRFHICVDDLAIQLEDPLPIVRYATMNALGMIATQKAFTLLTDKLVEARNDTERRKIIERMRLAIAISFARNHLGRDADVLILPESAINVLKTLTGHRSIISKESGNLLNGYYDFIQCFN